MAKEHFEESMQIHHGFASSMPFDQEVYDGIFSYSLIHLSITNLGPVDIWFLDPSRKRILDMAKDKK